MEDQLYHEFFELEDRHWWFVARRRILRDVIRRDLQLPARSSILDVGCGTGAFLADCSSEFQTAGTDTSPLAVEYCRQRGLRNIVQCTLDAYPHPEERFDLITLLDVIEHVDDDQGLLRNALALLRPSGRLLVTVPAYQFLWSRHDEVNHHKRRYTASRLVSVLRNAGFTVQRTTYLNTFLFPLAAAERIAGRLRTGRDPGVLSLPPAILNKALLSVFASERHLLRFVSFPFGLSVMAIAVPQNAPAAPPPHH